MCERKALLPSTEKDKFKKVQNLHLALERSVLQFFLTLLYVTAISNTMKRASHCITSSERPSYDMIGNQLAGMFRLLFTFV